MTIEVLKGDARSLDNGSNHRDGNMKYGNVDTRNPA